MLRRESVESHRGAKSSAALPDQVAMARLDSSEMHRGPSRSSTPTHPPTSPSAYSASAVRQLRTKASSSRLQIESKPHASAHEDEGDLDPEGFGCRHTTFFDRQAWKYDHGGDGPVPDVWRRQNMLDSYFSYLSEVIQVEGQPAPSFHDWQKDKERRKQMQRRRAGSKSLTGVHEEEEEQEEQKEGRQRSVTSKPLPHFLDFSSFINPLPIANKIKTKPARLTDTITKSSEVICFQSPFTQSYRPKQPAKQQVPQGVKLQRPPLHGRKSEGSLRDRKREKNASFSASLFSQTGVATAENVGPGRLNSSECFVDSLVAEGQRQQHHQPRRMGERRPNPSLPKWAQESNRKLSQANGSGFQSTSMETSLSTEAYTTFRRTSDAARPIAMGRIASDNPSMGMSSRPVMNGRAASGPAAPIRSLQQPQHHDSQSTVHETTAAAMQQPTYSHSRFQDESRDSISSASAVSEDSSDVCSIPQTPTSRNGSSELSPLHCVSLFSSSSPNAYQRRHHYPYEAIEWTNDDGDQPSSHVTPRAVDKYARLREKNPHTPRPCGDVSPFARSQQQNDAIETIMDDGTIKASHRYYNSTSQRSSLASKCSRAGHFANLSISSVASSSSSDSSTSTKDSISPSTGGLPHAYSALYALPVRKSSTNSLSSSSSNKLRTHSRQHAKSDSDGSRGFNLSDSIDAEGNDKSLSKKPKEEEESLLGSPSALAYRLGEPLSPPPAHQVWSKRTEHIQPLHAPMAAFMTPPSSSPSSRASPTSIGQDRIVQHQRSHNFQNLSTAVP